MPQVFLELGLFNFCLIKHSCTFATQRAHEKWNQGSFPYFVSEHRKSLLTFHLFTLHLFPFLSGILYFLQAPLKFAAVVCFISPINSTAVELAFSAVVCFISPVNSLNSTTVELICFFCLSKICNLAAWSVCYITCV